MLISPNQIHQVIRESAAIREPLRQSHLDKLLNDANLSTPEVLEHVSLTMRSGETDAVRLKAAEMGLRLNGLLDKGDTARQDFNVTIIINDAEHVGINPILIPR